MFWQPQFASDGSRGGAGAVRGAARGVLRDAPHRAARPERDHLARAARERRPALQDVVGIAPARFVRGLGAAYRRAAGR